MISKDNPWYGIKDGDPRAYYLQSQHYSFYHYKDNRRLDLSYANRHLIVGPGKYIMLMTVDCQALFIWRQFINRDKRQTGINCSSFVNRGPYLSSELILWAEEIAANIWPGERVYTYIDPVKVASANPGYCFKVAGWSYWGKSGNGKHILEKWLVGNGKDCSEI